MRSRRWSGATARDEVSPYLTVSCVQLPERKFQESLATGCQYIYTPKNWVAYYM